MGIHKKLQSQLCVLCSVDAFSRRKRSCIQLYQEFCLWGNTLSHGPNNSLKVKYIFTEKQEFLVKDFVYILENNRNSIRNVDGRLTESWLSYKLQNCISPKNTF